MGKTKMRRKLRKFRKKLKQQLSFIKRRLVKPPLPKNSDGKVLVHIGCGSKNSPEFINVDARPFPHVHIITDNITSLPNFQNATVDMVYMCHILEHVKHGDLKKVLLEMKRVLKKGGTLRISVPDFDQIIHIYANTGKNINPIKYPLMGKQDYPYNTHYSVFNRQYLSELLQKVGFEKITNWDPNDCQYHDFEDFASHKIEVNGKKYTISLNLEAFK